jgi:hypothetical protein
LYDTAVTSSIYDLALQEGVLCLPEGNFEISEEDEGRNIFHTVYHGRLRRWYNTHNNFNISYSMLNTDYCSIVQEDAPQYPLDKTFIMNLFGLYNDYNTNGECLYNTREGYASSGFAGFNGFSRLCHVGSSNSISISSAEGNVEFSPCQESITSDPNRV